MDIDYDTITFSSSKYTNINESMVVTCKIIFLFKNKILLLVVSQVIFVIQFLRS